MEWSKKKPLGGSKYGLQLKIAPPAAAKKPQLKKPLPFSLDDDEEYTVEDDIARQASKKQFAHEVDLQIKQALEQDSSAFDYDGIYDQMKGQQAQPIREDREKREPKYIGKLLDKAKVRAVEHDIAFERRLAKERQKEDHLFGDKETFMTGAYKKKLIEQGKWKEEERLREMREKNHEVSGKSDLSDFYRNLLKNNVAFGAKGTGQESMGLQRNPEGETHGQAAELEISSDLLNRGKEISDDLDKQIQTVHGRPGNNEEEFESRSPGHPPSNQLLHKSDEGMVEENPGTVPGSSTDADISIGLQQNSSERALKKDGHIPNASVVDRRSKEDAVTAAKERYLARKRQRN